MTTSRLLYALLATVIALVPSPDAHAVADENGALVAAGYTWPGLPTTGCALQDPVVVDGTAVLTGDVTGSYVFDFVGASDICESLNVGDGWGNVSGDMQGVLGYSRTSDLAYLRGTLTLGAVTYVITEARCTWAPRSFIPVRDFSLDCAIVLSR